MTPCVHFFSQRIQDYHLIGVVCALSGMMTCIVVLWEIIGPHEVIRKYLTEQVTEQLHRGSYMSAHVLLNLSKDVRKRDQMRGLLSILSFSQRV